jgi:hypothetical protein
VLPRRPFSFALGFSLILAAGCDIGQSTKDHPGGSGTGGGAGGTASSSSSGATGGATGSTSSGTTSTSSSTSGTTSTSSSTSSTSGAPAAGLKVSGNKLVDNGQTVRLLGVDRSGTEYQCIHGAGVFDGPADQGSVTDMKAWHINTVRVPLNEDCWLNINGAPAQYSGSNYINPISTWVSLLRQNGLYVILDLHWNNGGGAQANSQQQMADADHAPAFWSSVASTFKGDLGVVFDLYNEPHDVSWSCWQNGGCQVNGWSVAGMNQLISAVRGAGAENVVMAGGLSWSGDLSQWLANKPSDPANNLAASFHSYNFSNCADSGCWSSQLAPVAAQVPLITGELGENDCGGGSDYIKGFMNWADGAGVSYVGWAWSGSFDHCSGPSLLTSGNWDGTSPSSPFGADFKAHLAAINP